MRIQAIMILLSVFAVCRLNAEIPRSWPDGHVTQGSVKNINLDSYSSHFWSGR